MNLKKLLLLAILILPVDLCAQEPYVTFDPRIDKGKITSSIGASDAIYKNGIKIYCSDAAFAFDGSVIAYKFYSGSKAIITSTVGPLTKIEFTCMASLKEGSPAGLKYQKPSFGKLEATKNIATWRYSNGVNVLTFGLIQPLVECSKIEVTVDKYPNTTTISSAGYATYCCDKAVDYTKTYGLVAYKAKYDSEKKMIVLTKVGKVPANTPVVLKGEGGLYGFPTLESAPKAVTDNDLKVATTDMTCTNNMWILVKKSTGVGFAPATPGTTLAKGKCYLVIESDASSKFLPFDETTGISHISPNAVRSDGKTYNILGQEVGNDYKGIVILDGKKVVRK